MLLLAVTLAACGGDNSSESRGVNQGNLASGFTLEALDGREVSLSEYRGKHNVLIAFFPLAWTPI